MFCHMLANEQMKQDSRAYILRTVSVERSWHVKREGGLFHILDSSIANLLSKVVCKTPRLVIKIPSNSIVLEIKKKHIKVRSKNAMCFAPQTNQSQLRVTL